MLYAIAILAYLAVAAAHTSALERIFLGGNSSITTSLCGLIWPLTAPFVGIKLAAARLAEKLEK